MGSDPSLHGQVPRPTEAPRPGTGAKPAEPPAVSSHPHPSSLPPSPAVASSIGPEHALELERLRAERDALAAELQIERAERLRAEERLRLFEREKLEQMREGAASREKLASELEEARLRAMGAEGRQATLEAEMRLAEIAERRRAAAWPPAGSDAPSEVAEPDADGPTDETEPEEAPEPATPDPPRPRRIGYSIPGSGASKYSRASRQASRDADGTTPSPAGGARTAEGPTRRDAASAAGRPATPPRSGGFGAGGDTGAGAGAPSTSKSGPPSFGDRDRTTAAGARGGAAFQPRGGSTAKGGAASGRPSIDRAQLEARLSAGQAVEITERFRQFQPVAQTHIKICDWLAKAKTLDEIEALAAGEVARSEIVTILTLFFERSFLVFKS